MADAGCALDFSVSAASTMTLDSFFPGGWFNTARNVARPVYDPRNLAFAPASGSTTVDGFTGAIVDVGLTSGTVYRLLFGPDGINGGTFDITCS